MTPGVKVSVVVPLQDVSAAAEECLRALTALAEAPPFELVVVAGATDPVDALPLAHHDVSVVRRNGRNGLAVSAALGTAHAHGDVVVLLRDHGVVQPGWLEPLVATLRDPEISAVASVRTDDPEPTPAVAAPALAWRRPDLAAVPHVPDDLVVAALCAELARRGEIEVASASEVAPAAAS